VQAVRFCSMHECVCVFVYVCVYVCVGVGVCMRAHLPVCGHTKRHKGSPQSSHVSLYAPGTSGHAWCLHLSRCTWADQWSTRSPGQGRQDGAFFRSLGARGRVHAIYRSKLCIRLPGTWRQQIETCPIKGQFALASS